MDQSNNELQTTTTPQRRGSETSEGGEEPNGSEQETHAKEEKKQESDLSSQENTDKSEEDQHKTNREEPAKEVETTKNNNVVGEEEASSDGNKSSETSKDQNLSQAAVTKPQHDQPQTNHEDPGDEVKATKSGDVMKEAGTSSEIPPQEENIGDCNQNDEDAKPPITTEQESSEKNEDGKKPNSPLVKPEFSEDIKEPSPPTENSENLTAEDGDGEQEENDQQTTDYEESAKEAESTKNVPVEEEEACGDMDDRNGEENSEDPNQDDEEPQPPLTPEQRSLKGTKEEKGPNLSQTETTESEQNQQKIDHEDWGGDENQATKKEKVLEEVKASSDVDDRSREENSEDPSQHDKDTKPPTVLEPQKTDTPQSAAEQREHHGGSEKSE